MAHSISGLINRSVTSIVAISVYYGLTGFSSAIALPAFTFDPSAVGLSGTSFTADNMILSDFSSVIFTPNGSGGASFTDAGVMPVAAFQVGSSPVNDTNLNTGFGMYFQFTASGTQNTPDFNSTTVGQFNSLQYSLYGYSVTGPVSYEPLNITPTGVSNPILLASGSLISGGVGATTLPNLATVPNANTLLTFEPNAKYLPFFVSPTPFFDANFAAFTNNPSQIQISQTGFVITNGGGSANFLGSAVPEPGALGLLGLGFGGLLLTRTLRIRPTV